MDSNPSTPHLVCIPSPFQSHIKAMLKLSKLLHHRGFFITFINTEFNHRRFIKTRGANSLNNLPNFQFETIPDGLPTSEDDNIDATQDLVALCENIRNNVLLQPFRELLCKLNDSSRSSTNAAPPITYIISDGFLSFTISAAQQLGVPIVLFFTVAACSFMGFKQFEALKEKGLTPLRDETYITNGYLETIIDWIPGMIDIRIRDLPSYIRAMDQSDILYNLSMEATKRACEASAIIIHTFDALEQKVLDALSSMFPRLYTIGPLELLLKQTQQEEDPLVKSIGYNLCKEETECFSWLDSKEPNSVVYVNFGSIEVMTKQQLIELGMGLANSNHSFLWIIRPDLVIGDSAIFPTEFVEKTQGKLCFIASWCPQEEVLNHPSIGGFLTHCGWNSTIESLCAGVPMMCCPFSGDQQTNCRYTCREWGIGLEIGEDVKRNKVEKMVRELMEGENGKRMKKMVMEWKRLAEEATGPDGSSTVNLEKLVNQVLLSKDHVLPK